MADEPRKTYAPVISRAALQRAFGDAQTVAGIEELVRRVDAAEAAVAALQARVMALEAAP
jgi:hypothetical protein